jgi:hypothetical protein
MKHLGVQQKEDLPDFSKFQELLKVFDPASEETPAPGEDPKGKLVEQGA